MAGPSSAYAPRNARPRRTASKKGDGRDDAHDGGRGFVKVGGAGEAVGLEVGVVDLEAVVGLVRVARRIEFGGLLGFHDETDIKHAVSLLLSIAAGY